MEADGSTTAIIPATLNARAVAELARTIQQSIIEIRKTVLHEGSDFGKIPGTNKDVLLKPGAEKMSSAFKLYPVPKLLTCIEDWEKGFFFYRYQISMVHRETDEIWGTAIGSCNSREKKYAWRWVTESELPAGIDKDGLLKEDGVQTLTEFDFAVNKAETSGQYAKSAEHWKLFKDAIAAGKAKKIKKETKRGMSDAWEITTGVVRYRIPHPEICDLVNTIDKMAYKRAYVAAVLIATNASEFFTQDMEDFVNLALPPEETIIEGQMEDVTPPAASVPDVSTEDAKEALNHKPGRIETHRDEPIITAPDSPFAASSEPSESAARIERGTRALMDKLAADKTKQKIMNVPPQTFASGFNPSQAHQTRSVVKINPDDRNV